MAADIIQLVADRHGESSHGVEDLERVLGGLGEVRHSSFAELEHAAAAGGYAVMVADLREPGRDDLAKLHAAKRSWPDLPLVVVADGADAQAVVSALRAGADEVVLGSPQDLPHLPALVGSVLLRARHHRALVASEALFRRLFETAKDGILLLNGGSGTIVAVNPRVTELLGYSRSEMIGRRPGEFGILPGVVPGIAPLPLRQEQDSHVEELRLTTKAGRQMVVELASCAFQVDGERVIQCSIHDISSRKRAEELQAAIYEISEAALHVATLDDLYSSIHAIVARLMEARNFYIAIYDPDRNLITFPYFADEVDPPPDPFPPGRGVTSWVLRSGKPLLATPDVLRDLEQDGESFPLGAPSVDWLGVPLKVRGETIGVLAVQSYTGTVRYSETDKEILVYVSSQVAQVIARKRAEQAQRASEARLRESEETARALINAPGYDAVLLDPEGKVLAVNSHVAVSVGRTAEELIGTNLWDHFEPEVAAIRRAHVEEVVHTGKPVWFEDERRGRWFDSTFFPVFDAKGGLLRVAIIARDVTEAKRAERALRESQKMRAIGQLAGGVAHDFNNLLQALLGGVELVRARSGDPEGLSRALAEVEADVRRGAAVTRQLLLFARREVVKLERLDLNDVARQTTTLLRRLLRVNIRCELALCEQALPVIADRGQLEQVLVNLAVNAADVMPEGGRLYVRSGRLGNEEAFLEVEDTGTGMPEEVRTHIFEPFFTTKPAGQGTGLGLAVVHGIVSQHGGRVEVDSRPGVGSRFTVALPLQSAGLPTAGTRGDPACVESFSGKGERVLVVDDDDAIRQGLSELLALAGYTPVAVGSGEEAIALPSEEPFSLLLCDLVLPGIHGGELVRLLRARWPSLKVILMSGYAEDTPAHNLGVDPGIRFLQKPFDLVTLTAEMHAALEGSPGPAA